MEVAFTLEADVEDQGSDSINAIQSMIEAKTANLKRLDFYNLLFPFKRIEAALLKQPEVSSALLELRLSSCKLLPQECLCLAESPVSQHLRSLDLSCNPLKLQGLLNLLD